MAASLEVEKLTQQCEQQELEAPGGVATPEMYSKLLTLYLLQNDLNNAKFLWKRIPQPVKTANPELGHIWAVGQQMWHRDFPATYSAMKKDWSEPVKPMMDSLLEHVRQRVFKLISRAYTSIEADELASYVGLPLEQAINAVVEEGWTYNADNKMIHPKQEEIVNESPLPSEQQISQLTDFVAFLEN
ncbi:COP9 signalosome complex subunit 8-like [Amphiura filiformis]|uniref:COP9 signalosome complex subunit 8-like n=1 Tax=Amphiura filiformis TaxID=82378 RepID=UPI003B2177E7